MNLTVGKVPGTVKQITINSPATVFQAMQTASSVCNFTFSKEPYSANGKEMVDVPFLNGRELATREGKVITSVLWDTPVGDGDIILLVPKIKGNQFIVTVAHVQGQLHTVALLHANEPEAQPWDGTVENALRVAGLEYDGTVEEIFVNGNPAEMSTLLSNNDAVTISEKISVKTSEIFEEQEEAKEKKYFTVFKWDSFKVRISYDYSRILIILK